MPQSTPQRSVLVILETLLGLDSLEEREAWIRENLSAAPEIEQKIRKLLSSGSAAGALDDLVPTMEQLGEYLRDLRGEEIGPYVLLEKLGSGGMGDVYLAHQNTPIKRLVAIKVLHGDLDEQVEIKRFQREQQVLARLQHPNIAHIYDAGKMDNGYSYIAMEYVDGLQFHEYCRRYNLSIRERLELFIQCCWAIEHAHQKGIIHRDIKPSNVLVTQVNQVASIKVIDFGIAKAQWSDTYSEDSIRTLGERVLGGEILTEGGRSPGTPPFMSPEQGSLDPHMVDTRSDVYSLGALLYTLLTDCEPYDWDTREGRSVDEFIKTVKTKPLELPSKRSVVWASQLRGDLDAIVSKAMEIEPHSRYQSVSELIEDVNCYQHELPIRAVMQSPWRRTYKFVRRNRIALGAGFLVISSLVIGLLFSIFHWVRARDSERVATQSRVGAYILAGSLGLRQGSVQIVEDSLTKSYKDSWVLPERSSVPVQRLDWKLLNSLRPNQSELLGEMEGKIYFGLSIPERRELVVADNRSNIVFMDADTPGMRRLEIVAGQKDINGLALSPDHRTVASAGDDGSVKFWDVATGQLQRTLRVSSEHVFQCKWSANGQFFCTAGNEPGLFVWSVPNYELVHKLPSSEIDLECMDIGPQGQLVYGAADGIVRIGSLDGLDQQVQSLVLTMSRVTHVNRCSVVLFSHSGDMLGVGLDNGFLVLLRRIAGVYKPVERIKFRSGVTSLAFSSDEKRLAIGDTLGNLHLLQLQEHWPMTSTINFRRSYLEAHPSVFLRDGQEYASLWDYVTKATQGATRESVSGELDRVELELNDYSLPKLQYNENYVREWLDENGEFHPEWVEFPTFVQFKEKGIELHFSERFSEWKEAGKLGEQFSLRSWGPHRKRISGVFWGADETSIKTVSEDRTVRSLELRYSGAGLVQQASVDNFIVFNGDRVMVNGAGGGALVLNLSDTDSRPVSVENFDREIAAVIYPTPGHPDVVYGWRSPREAESRRSQKFFRLNTRDMVAEPLTSMPVIDSLWQFLGVVSRERLVLFYRSGESGEDSSLVCWNAQTEEVEWKIGVYAEKCYVRPVSDCGRFIAFVIENTLHWVDVDTGKMIRIERELDNRELACAFSPDSKYIVTSLNINLLRCYRVSDGGLEWSLQVAGPEALDIDWSQDGQTLVAVGLDGVLRTYDTTLRQMTSEFALFNSDRGIEKVKLSPKEDWLFVKSRNGSLYRIPCKSLGDH